MPCLVYHMIPLSRILFLEIKIFYQKIFNRLNLRKSGAFKLQGFSSILCFFVLFQSVFFQTSLFQQYKNHKRSFPCSVDTLYRFLNSTSVNWWRFTTLLSLSIIKNLFFI